MKEEEYIERKNNHSREVLDQHLISWAAYVWQLHGLIELQRTHESKAPTKQRQFD